MRRVVVLLIVLAVVALGAATLRLTSPDEGPTDPSWAPPPGQWNRLPATATGVGTGDAEERASLLSLPYSAGGAPAPDARGVVHHDRESAVDGVNLYVSGHGPEAILIDMEGRFLHRWRARFEDVFPDHDPGRETDFWRRAHLLDDGSVLALFQGGGLARIDRHSNVVWASPGAFFNDVHVDGDRVLTIGKRAETLPELRATPVLLDFIAVLDLATGDRRVESPLLPAFRRGGFEALLEPLPDHADIFHTNTVTVLDGPEAHPAFAAGNVLVSLREVDLVAVLDPAFQEVLWARRGPWRAQHEPVAMPGGGLLVFDNRGAPEGRSRVVLWDLATDRITWSFEAPGFASPQAGTVQPLARGHLLVTSSEQGRAFELDDAGRVVWELVSPHRAGTDDELVATLFDVQRLPRERASWLDSSRAGPVSGSATAVRTEPANSASTFRQPKPR